MLKLWCIPSWVVCVFVCLREWMQKHMNRTKRWQAKVSRLQLDEMKWQWKGEIALQLLWQQMIDSDGVWITRQQHTKKQKKKKERKEYHLPAQCPAKTFKQPVSHEDDYRASPRKQCPRNDSSSSSRSSSSRAVMKVHDQKQTCEFSHNHCSCLVIQTPPTRVVAESWMPSAYCCYSLYLHALIISVCVCFYCKTEKEINLAREDHIIAPLIRVRSHTHIHTIVKLQ